MVKTNTTQKETETLIQASKLVSLKGNKEKTKCICLTTKMQDKIKTL